MQFILEQLEQSENINVINSIEKIRLKRQRLRDVHLKKLTALFSNGC